MNHICRNTFDIIQIQAVCFDAIEVLRLITLTSSLPSKHLILDLSKVSLTDISAMKHMLNLKVMFSRRSQCFIVAGVQLDSYLYSLFEIARVRDAITLCSSLEEAESMMCSLIDERSEAKNPIFEAS